MTPTATTVVAPADPFEVSVQTLSAYGECIWMCSCGEFSDLFEQRANAEAAGEQHLDDAHKTDCPACAGTGCDACGLGWLWITPA